MSEYAEQHELERGLSGSDPDSPEGQSEHQPEQTVVDLDAVERDLADVEAALRRLADGTYWTDEVTGQPLPEDLLIADPTARRA